jgi:hypothetical protein
LEPYPWAEKSAVPVTDFLVNVGEPWGPAILPVGDHPRWRAEAARTKIMH